MTTSKNKNAEKARLHELKGDDLLEKGKKSQAFESYKKALRLDATRIEIYDKLIALHNEFAKNWDEKDFAWNLWLGMKKQEVLDPTFKRIHARAEPLFKKITDLIKKMFNTEDQAEETRLVEEIAAHGPDALYPLVDYILGLKNLKRLARNMKSARNS